MISGCKGLSLLRPKYHFQHQFSVSLNQTCFINQFICDPFSLTSALAFTMN